MAIVKTAYKYRLYPSKKQKEILNRQMFLAKEPCNIPPEKSKPYYKETGKALTEYRMNMRLGKPSPWRRRKTFHDGGCCRRSRNYTWRFKMTNLKRHWKPTAFSRWRMSSNTTNPEWQMQNNWQYRCVQ